MSKSIVGSAASRTLKTVLAERGALPPKIGLAIFRQLLRQVRALHAGGATHRAVGPDTVLLDATGRAALAAAEPVRELDGADAGSDFCPPELAGAGVVRLPADIEAARQELGRAGVALDPRRIDVYQLGAVLCQLLTGQAVSAYLCSPKTKSKVPTPVQPLIERALGHNAADRFADCDAFAAALEAAGRAAPAAAPETPSAGSAVASPSNTPAGGADSPSGPSPPPSRELPFTRLGHYRVDKRIGRGGMGDVYLGYEESLQRPVAIKVLPAALARDDDFVRRFRAEATAVARLTHPNIVPIYFIGQDAGCHFFVMQYVEGESLDRLLARKGRLGVEEALGVLEQCLAGLGAAHQAGLVHRDVKPGNILLDGKTGRALVADFGLVKTAGSGGGMTATGMVLGTVDYIAPEQARGRDVDGRADLYALGVLAYQMLSGRLPFKADTPSAMIFQHAYETPPPLREVVPETPGPLAAVVDKLMAKDPAARYQSSAEVLADFRRWRAGEPLAADVETPAAERPSQIIPAPDWEPPPALPLGLEEAGWWQRLRDRVLDWFQARAPELAKRLQNTEQQVDGAVAEYQRRRDRLAGLMEEAAEAAGELAAQADSHREAAAAAASAREREECERVAADLEAQAAEQQGHISRMRAQLAQVDATLARLRSQNQLLQARVRVAAARLRMEEGPARPRLLLRRLVVAAVLVLVLFVVLSSLVAFGLYYALAPRETSTAAPIPAPGADPAISQSQPAEKDPARTEGPLPAATPAEITNSLGMKLELIKPGTFTMGSPNGEEGRDVNDEPQREVEITKAFYMGACPVTKGQFAAFVKEDGYQTDAEKDGQGGKAFSLTTFAWEQNAGNTWRQPGFPQGDDHPVVEVSGNDATAFCAWLSKKEGKIYKLPMEAEWEYACRAGTKTRFWCGDTDDSLKENANVADASLKVKFPAAAWAVPWNDGYAFTSPVGRFSANPWGLYDMAGNVNQWCADGNGVVRGGSWFDGPGKCRSAYRAFFGPPVPMNSGHGFRVVLRTVGGSNAAGGANPQQPPAIADIPARAGPLALPATDVVTAAAFSPEGRRLAVGGTRLRLWDLGRNKLMHEFDGLTYSTIRAVAWSADGRRVLMGGSQAKDGKTSGVAVLFEADTGQTVMPFTGHPTAVGAVALSSDGREVLTGEDDVPLKVAGPGNTYTNLYQNTEVRRWDVATGKELGHYQGLTAPTHSIAFTPDGKRIFAAGSVEDPAVYSWDVGTPSGQRMKFPNGLTSTYAVLSPDAGKAACLATNWGFFIYDLKDGNPLKEICRSAQLAHIPDPAPEAPAWSRDGRFVACSSWEYPNKPGKAPIFVVDAVSGQVVRTFEGHRIKTKTLAVSDDGCFIFSSSDDGNRLWEVRPRPDAGGKPEALAPKEEITNSIGMKLTKIGAGKFLMGAPANESADGLGANESPQHDVEITRPFFIGAHPVTVGQFRAFVTDIDYKTEAENNGQMGSGYNKATRMILPNLKFSWRDTGFPQGEDHPVVNVTWNDAMGFCQWLSKKEGKSYELPTEAEWEYACRAGTTTRFWCGDDDDCLKGNANLSDASAKAKYITTFAPVAWDDGYPFTSPVESFKPNPWGLYDMSGNVQQWCADRFGPYADGPVKDPKGADNGAMRVLRGGSFGENPAHCRSAWRAGNPPNGCSATTGFRVMLRPKPE